MKAAWYERNGAARDVLFVGEMDRPEPEPGEVRVRLATSGINPSDVKTRRGRPLAAPRVIPHSDGAGVIDSVGTGVSHSRVDERVWIWNGQWNRAHGTAAEYICVPENQAVRLPDGVDFDAGACLGIPALTALHGVGLCGVLGGKTLLVTGAGSTVGYYAVQMAKLLGARVIGTASAGRTDLARDAGADFIIDYRKKDVAAVVNDLTRGEGVHAVFDMDFSSTARLLAEGLVRPHGTVVCYGSNAMGEVPVPFQALLWKSLTLRFFLVYDLTDEERSAALSKLTRLLASGDIKHAIGARYPLRNIAEAHEAVEGGKVEGNVVLQIG